MGKETEGDKKVDGKKIGTTLTKWIRDNWVWAAPLTYIYFTMVGMFQSWFQFNAFGINVFDFSELNDFLLAAFREPKSFLFILGLIVYLGLLLLSKRAVQLILKKCGEKGTPAHVRDIPVKLVKIVMLLAFVSLVLFAPYYIPNKLNNDYDLTWRNDFINENKRNVKVFIKDLETNGKKNEWIENLAFIGTTEKFLFFVNKSTAKVIISPVANVVQIEHIDESSTQPPLPEPPAGIVDESANQPHNSQTSGPENNVGNDNKVVVINLPDKTNQSADPAKENKGSEYHYMLKRLKLLFTGLLSKYFEDKDTIITLASTIAEDTLSLIFNKFDPDTRSTLYEWLVSLVGIDEEAIQDFIIRFDFQESKIPPSGHKVIEDLKDILSEKNYSQIVVTGYADTVGTDDLNLKLAQDRANTISNLLDQQGFNKEKIEVVSKGESELPIITMDEISEPENRRVRIEVKMN